MPSRTMVATGLIYGASFVWHKAYARKITSPPVTTQTVNDLTVQLSSPGGQLKSGDNDMLIEFRDCGGQLVDVGTVKFEANMNMPGMQMHEAAKIQSAGTPGRYRAKIKVEMAGDWMAKISYEGPKGNGQVSFNLNTKP